MAEQIGNSPAGIIEEVPNLQRRNRSRYWRPIKQPDGTMGWGQTMLLPSDLVGRNQYLRKGFRLDNPNEVNAKEDEDKVALEQRIAELEAQLTPAEEIEKAPVYVSDKPPKKRRTRKKN